MKKALFFLFLSSLLSFFSYAGDHSFSIKFEINKSGIDRALQQQYNQAGFPVVVNGTIAGITYSLHLELPHIILLNNALKIRMELDVISSVGNFNDIVFEPTINIPQGSISTNQVTGFLTDLPTVVQGINGIPQWLKDAIVAAYNSFEPWVYPSKLINSINNSSTFLIQRNVDITNLTLGWQVTLDFLKLIVTTNLNALKPNFQVSLWQYLNNDDVIGIRSNIKVHIDEIRLLPLGGSFLLWSNQPNQYCEKDQAVYFNMGNLGLAMGPCFVAKILYSINETFYYREYGCVQHNSWHGHTKEINN